MSLSTVYFIKIAIKDIKDCTRPSWVVKVVKRHHRPKVRSQSLYISGCRWYSYVMFSFVYCFVLNWAVSFFHWIVSYFMSGPFIVYYMTLFCLILEGLTGGYNCYYLLHLNLVGSCLIGNHTTLLIFKKVQSKSIETQERALNIGNYDVYEPYMLKQYSADKIK